MVLLVKLINSVKFWEKTLNYAYVAVYLAVCYLTWLFVLFIFNLLLRVIKHVKHCNPNLISLDSIIFNHNIVHFFHSCININCSFQQNNLQFFFTILQEMWNAPPGSWMSKSASFSLGSLWDCAVVLFSLLFYVFLATSGMDRVALTTR